MKKYFILILMTFLSLATIGQISQVSISEEFKIAENDYKNQVVSHSVFHNNAFYTASNSGIGGNYKWAFTKLYDLKYSVTVSKFDKGMNKVKEITLANGEKLYGPLVPKLLLLNNKLCLAYFQSDNKTSFNLYLALVDENSLAVKEPKMICSIKQENVGVFKLESIINGKLVSFYSSPDNEKTLVVCKTTANSIQTFVVDSELNIQKQSRLQTNLMDFEISNAVLMDDKFECLLVETMKEARILCNDLSGKKSEFKWNAVSNLVPYTTNLTPSKDGKSIFIYSTATGSEEGSVSCDGFLLSQLDCSSAKMSKTLTYEFTPELKETIFSKGGGTKKKKEYFINNFSPHLMEFDNGEVVILGSPQNVIYDASTSAPNMQNKTHTIATTTINVGPVLAFFLNKSGKTFDITIVPRKVSLTRSQSSGSGNLQLVQSPRLSGSFSSFSASNRGNEIVVVYNDGEKNLTRGIDEKIDETDSPKDLVLAEALIGKDKKLGYRKQIALNAKGKYSYFLGNSIPATSSSIIFPIAKQGSGFNGNKILYSNWCFLDMKQP